MHLWEKMKLFKCALFLIMIGDAFYFHFGQVARKIHATYFSSFQK